MPPSQPIIETLHGFGVFTKVIARGKKYEKPPIKAFVLSSKSSATSLRVGYAVVKGIKTAVQRNRIKRLMREAFRIAASDFTRQLRSESLVEIVFMYNDRSEITQKEVRFTPISEAFYSLSSIISHL